MLRATTLLLTLTASATTALAQGNVVDHRKPRPPGPPPVKLAVREFLPHEGGEGTRVFVRGAFPEDVKVSLGNREMTLTSNGHRQITFTVPAMKPGPRPMRITAGGVIVVAGEFMVTAGAAAAEPPNQPPGGPGMHRPGGPGMRPPMPGGHPVRHDWRERWREMREPVVSDFGPRQGKAGATVVIRGQRLAGDILFGDQVVKATAGADGELTFVVPALTGTVQVALRRPGKPDLAVGSFEFAAQAPPSRIEIRKRWKQQAEKEWLERRKQLARTVAERVAAMKAHEEEMARDREQRREQRLAQIRARWERAFLAGEDVQAELALHAERMARLDRMQRLAEANDSAALVIRIRIAIAQEDDRHDLRMKDLRAAHGGN